MYKRSSKGWAKHLDFYLLDCICVMISFIIASWIRNGWQNPLATEIYRNILIMVVFLDFILMQLFDTMKDVIRRGYWREFTVTVRQALLLLVSVATFMYMIKMGASYSRIVTFLATFIYITITYLVRITWKKHVINHLRHKGKHSLLIMTSPNGVPIVMNSVGKNNFGNHVITGVVLDDDHHDQLEIEGIPVVAHYSDVVEYVTGNWVDEIIVSIDQWSQLPPGVIDTLTLMGVTVHMSMNRPAERIGAKQVVGQVGDLLVVSMSMNYMSPRQYFMKRGLDILGGIAGCIITGILYVVLAPAIKKESPGPVFFSQERVGKNGRKFKIYKFRSMYLDAEERKAELMAQNRLDNDLMFKMDFDPRVIGNRIDENGNQKTGIGELIRKYSLDEFPQFYNVLKGDMSMVGTRPPLVSEYQQYSAHHKARLATKPGITGMWQVSGRSDILDFEEVVRLDTEYINNWSLGLDIKIILKTIKVVLMKEGSM